MAMLPTTTLAIALLATMQVGDTSPQITSGLGPDGLPTSGLDFTPPSGPNQGASIALAPQRHRLPPVRLAKHEVASSSAANEPNAITPPSSASPALPLPKLNRSKKNDPNTPSITAGSSMVTVGTSLAVVLGLFIGMAWLMKRNMPRGARAAPEEVLEVLGRAPLPGKQHLQVVRFGSKLVLLSTTTDGVKAVSEITDPDEVQRMVSHFRRETGGSSSQAFQEILTQMGREPARGFVDSAPSKTVPTRR